jgi:L-ascorbate metabolism protein UlaG (beta-lactamase superfamily)
MADSSFSRRAFLTGLAATGALGWVYDSNSLASRVIRGTCADFQRDPIALTEPDFSSWTDKTVDICWAGHATVLINFFGVHILTDPVLFDWVGAQIGIGTLGRKRLVRCALDADRLPRVDMLLLSHAHMDHMDMTSLNRIPRHTSVVTAPNTSDLISHFNSSSIRELRWNQQQVVPTPSGEVKVKAIEVKHWGARWRSDSYRGYVGYVLERGGKSILFGGDTAYTGAFGHLRGHKLDLAIMPIGSYGSRSGNHCTPEEAVQMVNESGANYIVPIHHSTFPIGQEPLEEPLERLKNSVANERVIIESPGQCWQLPV